MNTEEKDAAYIAHTYSRYPVCFVKGKGSHLIDEEGKDYIDMGSGIGVDIFGVADEKWMDAVTSQLHVLNHVSNLFYTKPMAGLAEMLCQKTGMKKVFFSNSGAEANECAIKGARKYSIDKYGKERNEIITLINGFHGRTITTLAATGQDIFHKDFFPFTPGFLYTPANDLPSFIKLCEEHPQVCAVMVEPIQGEGGVHPLSKEFFEGVGQYAKDHDILLIVDEVQTGNGRTGKLYGYMNYDVEPDIVSTAKGIGGGLPLGVTMFNEKTENVYTPGTHGSTFGGNPISCAGGLAVLETVNKPGFLDEVARKGAYIREKLLTSPEVASVSGMGLMIGIELKNKKAGDVVKAALDKGLLLLTAKTKIRLLPPLTITYEEIDKGLEILLGLLNA